MNHAEKCDMTRSVLSRHGRVSLGTGVAILSLCLALPLDAADVYARFRIREPVEGSFELTTGGYRHNAKPSWYLPGGTIAATAGQWTAWFDMTKWPLHGRLNRAGGVAEWPSMKVTLRAAEPARRPIATCLVEGQLADRPKESSVVIAFSERAAGNTIGFLIPHPLRNKKAEFETGSQMTARHLAWAREATGGKAATLRRFDIATTLWGHYDRDLARQALEALRLLGFNVVNGAPDDVLAQAGMRVLGKTWLYGPDPDSVAGEWQKFLEGPYKQEVAAGGWQYSNMAHWVVSDESQALDFRQVETNKLNGWFRDYLSKQGVQAADIGRPVNTVEYPAQAMFAKTLPRDASLPERRLAYHAAKFGHWWSVKQMRQISDLIRQVPPGMKSETLPSDHGFFFAWGPPHIGMSYRMLDLFELGAQHAVDVLSTEDWLGLNHMYGANYTWSGGQTFGYLNAIHRSAIGDKPIKLLGLITPSDDRYLRLKAYSALCQGAKAFFFWTFGPTYIGTENYWSDLRSEYDGIAKLTRSLEQAEPILWEARPVRDPVAILYSVSHDLWHTDNAAAFVEKRLTWHALRHLQVQPDFLREEDVTAGRLKDYKILFVSDWCVARKATEAIGKWVEQGGVVWLSAGAATRDEYYEPYVPAFAGTVWPADAATTLVTVAGAYNERRDLQTRSPMDRVKVATGMPAELPALGAKSAVLTNGAVTIMATFADGKPAAVVMPSGKGKVMALGFMPMLAYGRLAGFKPETLEEKWPESPRGLVSKALEAGAIQPVVRANVPVVEAGLLTGPKGSVVVLANYSYRPVSALKLDVRVGHPVTGATSTEGTQVALERTADGARLTLPLMWTDIVLLNRE